MNIVIDGNAFLNVSASIVKNMLHKDKRIGEKYYVNDLLDDSKFLLKQQAATTFRSFVINYFSSIVSPFKGSTGAVFFVFDSKSWRKEYIKQFFKEDCNEERIIFILREILNKFYHIQLQLIHLPQFEQLPFRIR
jgi:hypothetical protein